MLSKWFLDLTKKETETKKEDDVHQKLRMEVVRVVCNSYYKCFQCIDDKKEMVDAQDVQQVAESLKNVSG
jgi:hypothetical protein